jgi:uncharacterized protein (DUF433 family)
MGEPVTASALGRGLYTVADAARLGGVPARTLHNWLSGYQGVKGGRKRHAPLWIPEFVGDDGVGLLSFLDFQEARVINRIRNQKVNGRSLSMRTIRLALEKARVRFDSTHPFALQVLKHDGHRIFGDISGLAGELGLLDMLSDQRALSGILTPFLVDIEFEDNLPARWWPEAAGHHRAVVIDPRRRFGRPIVARAGIETEMLSLCASSNGVRAAAAWYGVHEDDVRAAEAYEKSLPSRSAA